MNQLWMKPKGVEINKLSLDIGEVSKKILLLRRSLRLTECLSGVNDPKIKALKLPKELSL